MLGEGENGKLILNGSRVSVWKDEKVLTVMIVQHCEVLMPQNYMFKVIKMLNFMLYIFYNNNKYCKIHGSIGDQ